MNVDETGDEVLTRLEGVFRGMDGGVLVTFSGGVDSSLLLVIAHRVLGDRAVAFTAVSPSLPRDEAEDARRFAASLGARQVEADPGEVDDPVYAANAGDRCYACKRRIMETAKRAATDLGLAWVVEGTVVDELQGHRPGMRAVREQGVRQPYLEAAVTKAQVRTLARKLGVPHWDRPAFACLGSRFPAGTHIDRDRLARVERLEQVLRAHGFRQFRARYHLDGDAPWIRLEVAASELPRVTEPGIRDEIVRTCKREGFRWITLDLEGYRTGSVSLPPSVGSGSATGR